VFDTINSTQQIFRHWQKSSRCAILDRNLKFATAKVQYSIKALQKNHKDQRIKQSDYHKHKTLPRRNTKHSNMAPNTIISSTRKLQKFTTTTDRIEPLLNLKETNNFAAQHKQSFFQCADKFKECLMRIQSIEL
jgi:hypothetical protein